MRPLSGVWKFGELSGGEHRTASNRRPQCDKHLNIMFGMARGWESKAVEAQQAEAAESRSPLKPPLTPEEKLKSHKKEGLLLDRKRIVEQLESATHPRYRVMLQDALAELDRKIIGLG